MISADSAPSRDFEKACERAGRQFAPLERTQNSLRVRSSTKVKASVSGRLHGEITGASAYCTQSHTERKQKENNRINGVFGMHG